MDDIAGKLKSILEDDGSVEMLKSMTDMLKGGENKKSDGLDIGKIAALASNLKDDDRIYLMKALRPFVSEQKRQSLDSITNMMRLMKVLGAMNDTKLF